MKDEQIANKPSTLISPIGADSTEIESYTQICSTVAGTIRWSVFAIGVCACASLLTLVTFYFGNLKHAIERREQIKTMACSSTSSEHKDDDYCKNNDEKLAQYKKQRAETDIVPLPVINTKVYATDFPIVVYALGIFFWYWLWNTLRFTRSMLCGFYNNSRTASIQPAAARTIASYFLLLWSGGARRNLHNTIRYILIGFIVVIFFDVGSDVLDYITDSQLSSEPGWDDFRYYIWGLLVAKFIFIGLSIYLLKITEVLLRDLRNLLILVEWSRSAFYPLIYQLFDALKDPLERGANETSYDENNSEIFQLRIRLKFKKKVKDCQEISLSAPVNLWQQAQKFAMLEKKSKCHMDWMLDKDEKQKKSITTFEERRMRRFFFEFLVNEEFEQTLAKTFNEQIIRTRGLEEKLRELRQIIHVDTDY